MTLDENCVEPADAALDEAGDVTPRRAQTPDSEAGASSCFAEAGENISPSANTLNSTLDALLYPDDACDSYFSSTSKWTLLDFIETCREQVGDTVFFASDFLTWHQRFLNRITAKIRVYERDGNAAKKNEAISMLRASRTTASIKEAKAVFMANLEVAEDKKDVRQYARLVVKEKVEDKRIFGKLMFKENVTDEARNLRVRKRKHTLITTPETPGHQTWEAVFDIAKKQQLPHQRLSMPCAERSRNRLLTTERSLLFVQAFVSKYAGNRMANRDFGVLCEQIGKDIDIYPIAYPRRVDLHVRHSLSLGRTLRNSPVHVRDEGDEGVPWDSDFVLITRTAAYANLVSGIQEVDDDWTKDDISRVEAVRQNLFKIVILAAVTLATRVTGSSEHTTAAGAVVRPATGRDDLSALGGVRWSFLAPLLQKLHALATVEAYDVLTNEMGKTMPAGILRDILLQFGRQPAKQLKKHVRLYGGMNFRTLEKATTFAMDEAGSHRPDDIAPAAWAIQHVSAFLELLITLRTRRRDLQPHLKSWEGLVLAISEYMNLDDVENEKLMEDKIYMKKRRGNGDVSEDEPAFKLEDPFRAVQSSSSCSGKTSSGGAVEDEELLQLRKRIAILEEKKMLREKLAALEAEVSEK